MSDSLQFNLSWNLALAIKGVPPPSILEPYDVERRPVIQAMLGYTTKLLGDIRDTAKKDVPWSRGPQLKQLGVNYRWSEIVLDERATTQPLEEL